MKQIFGTLVNPTDEMDLSRGGFDIDELVRSVSGRDSTIQHVLGCWPNRIAIFRQSPGDLSKEASCDLSSHHRLRRLVLVLLVVLAQPHNGLIYCRSAAPGPPRWRYTALLQGRFFLASPE